MGHWDGVTVYDFNSDGYAEVALKIADGVVFGDGQTWTHADDNRQWIAILDGRTGALRNYAGIPQDHLADGPMAAQFGVGYLDGQRPSLVVSMKNRIGSGAFNMMIAAYSWSGQNLTQQWKWNRGSTDAADGHNIRIVDVDGNGTDEIAHIGFVLNGDGTLRYSLASQGVQHGDRFHIADMDPANPGLEGYGVQQDNASGLREYYYDAATGQMIWQHVLSGTADVGRGMAGDVDPRHPGMEVWSFDGLYNAASNTLTEPNTSLRPGPSSASGGTATPPSNCSTTASSKNGTRSTRPPRTACPASRPSPTTAPPRPPKAGPPSSATSSATGAKRPSTPTRPTTSSSSSPPTSPPPPGSTRSRTTPSTATA
nr:hypothetical protein GCM10025732_36160 [Glycomyces mayteni]